MASNANAHLIDILHRFAGKRLLVVGDVMLDRYVFGKVDRINPEAPVPILLAESARLSTGGAGNAAKNASALGAKTTLVAVTGADGSAADLKAAGQREGYRSVLIEDSGRRTTEKRRYLIRSQQMLRVDEEDTEEIGSAVETRVIEAIETEVGRVDAILVSDYAKGAITKGVAAAIMRAKEAHNLLVLADTKPPNIEHFVGVSAISPNLQEAHEYLGLNRLQAGCSWEELASRLHERFKVDVYLTLSEDGVFVWSREAPGRHVPQAHRVEVADTSGCGDTAAVVLILARLCWASDTEAAELANAAGAVIASRVGATTLTLQELIEVLTQTHDSQIGT
jgi:rfaE bifunctional protein kinase chain/domain